MNNKKGFTLVEIMIVVVIIGLLAAMAIPAFQKVRGNSQRSSISNNLRMLANAADSYFLESGEAASVNSTGLVSGDYLQPFSPVANETYTGSWAPDFEGLKVDVDINGETETIVYPEGVPVADATAID